MQLSILALITALASLTSAKYCTRTCDWSYIAASLEGELRDPCVNLGDHSHPRPATECHYKRQDFTGATVWNSCCKLNFENWEVNNDKFWCEEIVGAQMDPYLPDTLKDPHRAIPQCEIDKMTGLPVNYGGHMLDAPLN